MDAIHFISRKRTSAITSLSERTISRKVDADEFPKPVRLGGGNRIAFVEAEVLAWNAARLRERDAKAAARNPPAPDRTSAGDPPPRRRAAAQAGR